MFPLLFRRLRADVQACGERQFSLVGVEQEEEFRLHDARGRHMQDVEGAMAAGDGAQGGQSFRLRHDRSEIAWADFEMAGFDVGFKGGERGGGVGQRDGFPEDAKRSALQWGRIICDSIQDEVFWRGDARPKCAFCPHRGETRNDREIGPSSLVTTRFFAG